MDKGEDKKVLAKETYTRGSRKYNQKCENFNTGLNLLLFWLVLIGQLIQELEQVENKDSSYLIIAN